VLATLAPGTVVEELGADSSGSQGWRRVLWNGREGWIAANLLRPAPWSRRSSCPNRTNSCRRAPTAVRLASGGPRSVVSVSLPHPPRRSARGRGL